MRFVIYGAGAIGGGVGARLHAADHEVTLIARGAHYEALSGGGLVLETPGSRNALQIPVVDSPAAIDWSPEHIVLMATKTQDSVPALAALAAAAPAEISVVCLQNGVANERMAIQMFPNVHGAVVMMPAVHLEPGVVQLYATPVTGIIDLGRYPHGIDDRSRELSAALSAATFSSRVSEEIMRSKYAKLLGNLANAVEAICGPDVDGGEVVAPAREEGRTAMRAAGIEFEVDERDATRRWNQLSAGPVAGQARGGGSTWQSVVRGSPSSETDYLNGEIVLLGRLHEVATPVNELLQHLVRTMIREDREPGWLTPEDVLARLD